MDTYNNLPLYLLGIDENDEETEVDFVALVDKPAIERDFLAFAKQDRLRFSMDEDRRIVTGPLMLADTPIYRRDQKKGEYYIAFPKIAIEKIAQKFFKNGYQSNVNLMHESGSVVEGLTMFESFITDSQRGIAPMKGFEDVPEGSWFGSFKVENDEVWKDIKEGKFKGFSIEGAFEVYRANKIVDQIANILKEAGFKIED
jgi:hypothetical protein